jgi:hypothetical protein
MTMLIINASGLLLMVAIVWWFWLYPRKVPTKLVADKESTSKILDERDMSEEPDDEEYPHRKNN